MVLRNKIVLASGAVIYSAGVAVLSLFVYGSFYAPKIYSLDLPSIVQLKERQIEKQAIANPGIPVGSVKAGITSFVKDINSDAKKISGRNGVIIVKNAVVGGAGVTDITARLENELKKQKQL